MGNLKLQEKEARNEIFYNETKSRNSKAKKSLKPGKKESNIVDAQKASKVKTEVTRSTKSDPSVVKETGETKKPLTSKALEETKDVKNTGGKCTPSKSRSRRTLARSLILRCEMCRRKFGLESSLKRHSTLCRQQSSSLEQPPAKKRRHG